MQISPPLKRRKLRSPETYKDIHRAGDIAERKLKKAIVNRWKTIKGRISINELALALHAKDQRKVMQIVDQFLNFEPLNKNISDTVMATYMRGGRLGEKRVPRGK